MDPATIKQENAIIEEKITKPNGETIIKKYQQGKCLGKGGFAKCYEITNIETKQIFAAKIIPKTSLSKNRARQKLISEIKIHKSLHHLHVVQFEHVFEDSENVYILLELCSNQTLNELIKRRKRLTDIETQCYVQQIILSLKYLHQNKVIHRDVKLGNLFLNKKLQIKIGDFGLAAKLDFEGERKRTICGTPNYIAPEILEGKNGHSYEVDVWSLGVIIYTLLIGKPPYETPDVKSTYKKIKANVYSFPEHIQISEEARSIITKILNLDPQKRPTLDEIMISPFLCNEASIPKMLPLSTLACPPSATYLKQFTSVTSRQQRVSDTTNLNLNLTNSQAFTKTQSKNFTQTDKIKPLEKNWVQGNDGISKFLLFLDFKGIQSTKNIQNNQAQSLNQFVRGSKIGNPTKGPEIWVQKWYKLDLFISVRVDYSSKYGLGYLLSNSTTGVYFNDSTKIITDPGHTYIEYMDKKPNQKQDLMTQYNLNDYPKDLSKKVTLLQHFRSYLQGEKVQEPEERSQQMVYVKKWMKTKHAIMFRLSNKVVQVTFTDKTEILLSSENKMVTYVNKQGERANYPLTSALESNNMEMAKRLKYTKEILTHMLSLQANNNKNDQLQQGFDDNNNNLF